MAGLLFLAACGPVSDFFEKAGFDKQPDIAKKITTYPGVVVSDEPQAALVGRKILDIGGTAADAAAVYFALSVTLPSQAGLGGGGVCVVWNSWNGKAEALDFIARRPASLIASIAAAADRPSAVPGNALGFEALQKKYGQLRWSQVVAPAEAMARFGVKISRALARDISPVGDALMADAATRLIFSKPGRPGQVAGEGDKLVQEDLADVLAGVRRQGAAALYTGRLAEKITTAVKAAGGTLELSDLGRYRPRWRKTIRVEQQTALDQQFVTLHFAPPPAVAGAVAADAVSMISGFYKNGGREGTPGPAAERHIFSEATMRAFADRDGWFDPANPDAAPPPGLGTKARAKRLMKGFKVGVHTPAANLNPPPTARPENPAATGFVTVDRSGSAVACSLTMNSLFGTGRVAPGTGIIPAAAPDRAGRGPQSLIPVLAVDPEYKDLYFAAAASGGVVAPTAMTKVITDIFLDGRTLEEALGAKRLHQSGAPDLIYHERGFDPAALADLVKRGHRVAATRSLGRVNAVACPGGLPFKPASCAAAADPRGFGLAVTAATADK